MLRYGHKVLRLSAIAGIAAALVLPVSVSAVTRIWTGEGDGTTWSDGNNWQGAVAPQAGDDIEFSVNAAEGTNTIYISVDTPQTIGSMYFNRVTQNHHDSYVITNQTLTVSPSGRFSTRDLYFLTSTVELHCDIVMDDDLAIEVSGGATWPVRFEGVIRDGDNDYRLTLNGGGNTVTRFNGDNSFGGGFNLVGGTARVYFGQPNAIGTGPVRLAAANAILYADEDTTVSAPLSIEAPFWYERYGSSGKTLSFNGPISLTNSPSVEILMQAGHVALNGDIVETGGPANLKYSAVGYTSSLTLAGSNTVSGKLTLSPNQNSTCHLILADPHALPGGTTVLTGGVSSASIILSGRGAPITVPDAVFGSPHYVTFRGSSGGPLVVGGTSNGAVGRVHVLTNAMLAVSGELALFKPSWADALLGIGHSYHLASGSAGGERDAALSPTGEETGILTISGGPLLFWNDSSRLEMDLNGGEPGTQHDQVVLNDGTSRLRTDSSGNGATLVPRVGGSIPADARLFIVVNNSGVAIENTFNGLTNGATVDLGAPLEKPASCKISYEGDGAAGTITGGNDIVLYDFVNTAPPRGTVLMVR